MKKPKPADMPEALAYPPRDLHGEYARRGAAATKAAMERRKRMAELDKMLKPKGDAK